MCQSKSSFHLNDGKVLVQCQTKSLCWLPRWPRSSVVRPQLLRRSSRTTDGCSASISSGRRPPTTLHQETSRLRRYGATRAGGNETSRLSAYSAFAFQIWQVKKIIHFEKLFLSSSVCGGTLYFMVFCFTWSQTEAQHGAKQRPTFVS